LEEAEEEIEKLNADLTEAQLDYSVLIHALNEFADGRKF